jgi:hypothetical protein
VKCMTGGPQPWLLLRQHDGHLRLLYHDLQHGLQQLNEQELEGEEQAYDDGYERD